MESDKDFLNADKLLFAVDLVDYIIIKTRPNFGLKTLNIQDKVDRIRNFTYNPFVKTIKKALNIIDINQDNSVYSDFETIMTKGEVNKTTFIEYASNYRTRHLADGFQAKSFLLYCDRVANMAGYFLSYGVEDAADIAVESIMQAFPKSFMHHKNWSELTDAAQTLVVLGSDYYGGNLSSESSSETIDMDSRENKNNNNECESMDVNVSSPEDTPIEFASTILLKMAKRKRNSV